MKAILIILSFSLATAGIFTACSKTTSSSYSCKCSGGISGQGQTFMFNNVSRSKAESACSSYNAPNSADGFYDCHLE